MSRAVPVLAPPSPALLALGALAAIASAARAAPTPRLDPPSVPADGAQIAELSVPAFGRFSIIAESKQGAAIRLVDRMEGPGPWEGVAGEGDGRVDAFLERGTYRIAVQGPEGGVGQVALKVVPSAELTKGAERLVPERAVQTTLGDHAQRSWWVDIEADQLVSFEAVGRHLADLRLWQDGTWLVDASPSCGVIEPVAGRPHTRCRLVRRLPKGLYRLSAYGGPGSPWAEAGDDAGLWLRWGIPRIVAPGGRIQRQIGAYGFDRFRLDGAAREITLALPEGPTAPVAIDVEDSAADTFGYGGGTRAEITKESRVPRERVFMPLVRENVVTVTGPPGQPYSVEFFPPSGTDHVLGGHGFYYLTTLWSGGADERPDATGLLLRGERGAQVVEFRQTVPLRSDRRYQRAFNLSGIATIYLDVEQTGDYVFEAPGAELRVEPVLDERPPGYTNVPWARDKVAIGLPTGPHLLTLKRDGAPEPIEVSVRPELYNPLASGLEVPKLVTLPPVIQLERVRLDSSETLRLLRNSTGDAPMGVVLRALPVALAEAPAPFTLAPGARVMIEAVSPGDGRVRAEAASGAKLTVSIDGGPFVDQAPVDDDTFQITVRNDSDRVVTGALVLTLTETPRATTPLPDERLEALPEFPRLTAAEPAGVELDRNSEKTWRLTVDEAALYRLESTGLLSTGGVLRTRTRVDFARAQGNGSGRNFRIARYLGAGDYQLTVATKGQSRGRLGVRLVTTPLIDGGALLPEVPARATVPAGQAVEYAFEISETARYRISSIGRGHTFDCRIEDSDRYPVTRPVVTCDETLELRPGRYRVIVLPTGVETQRLTRLRRLHDGPTLYEGHGPHALPLRTSVQHVWREPVGGGERTPDWWDFTLPADGEVEVALSVEMYAELLRRGGEGSTQVTRIGGGVTSDLSLEAGDYRLVVRGARRSDHLPYTLSVTPSALMAGQSISVRAPEDVAVAVGSAGLYEITSDGPVDVRARLLDADGQTVAFDDDRPDGWNFRLAERLAPGRYTLRVEQPGGDQGRTTLRMEAPTAVDAAPLAAGEVRTLVPDGASHYIPVPLKGAVPLLTARAESTQNVGLAIEANDAAGWHTLATATGTAPRVAARPRPGVAHRLRLWSLDQRGLPATVRAATPDPARPAAAALASGATANGAVAARVPAGLFAIEAPQSAQVCLAVGAGCRPIGERPVAVGGDGLLLVADGRVRARRLLADVEPVALTVDAGAAVRLDVAPARGKARGPLWVEAHSPIGRPGVHFDRPAQMGVGATAAASVDIDGDDPQVTVVGSTNQPIEVRVRAVRLGEPSSRKGLRGTTAGEIGPGEAIQFVMADGLSGRVTLAPGLAAAADGTVVWAADGPLDATMPLARQIWVLNPTETAARYRLVGLPADPATPRVNAAMPAEIVATRAGLQRVPVTATEGARLRLAGQFDDSTFVDADGRAHPADGADTRRGGVLWLRHRAGSVLAWLDGGDVDPWKTEGGTPRRIESDGRWPIEGATETLTLAVGGPAMVHLRLPAPHVARAVAGGNSRVTINPAGGGLDVWLPEGDGEVLLRGVAGAPLWGELEVTVSRPETIGEGLGPETLVGPGEARPFVFEVDREAAVGIGVSAAADRVDARLLDAIGREIARGPVQMPTLTPGRYVLVLTLAADAAPVVARPALAGVEPPGDTPPDEVVRKYLELAGYQKQEM